MAFTRGSILSAVIVALVGLNAQSMKTWPEQKKSQTGLSEPQDPATLPKSTVSPQKPVAKPVVQGPVLKETGPSQWSIRGGWKLAPAPAVTQSGDALSRSGILLTGEWLDAVVPGTVLTTLVDRGIYPDPDYGLNNLAIPETLNKQDYWYRVEFDAPASLKGRRVTLTFNGINYAAAAWLNGKELGSIRGAFLRGSFDVTGILAAKGKNTLAVRVSPPPHPGIPHEQSIAAGPGKNGGIMCSDGPTFFCMEGWDWIPGIRDRGTGIWQDVTLSAAGDIHFGDVQVITRVASQTQAAVTLVLPVQNASAKAVNGVVKASFGGVALTRKATLPPGESAVTLAPEEFPALNVKNPRLWWPNGYGKPELYHLKLSLADSAGRESDTKSLRFGIREISYELTLRDNAGKLDRVEFTPAGAIHQPVVDVSHAGIFQTPEGWVHSLVSGAESSAAIHPLTDTQVSPFLVIRVNGVRIAVRGGNWGIDDSRKRVSRERLEPYVRLHRDANLNMLRNWCGQSTEEALYDLADEYGILIWNDFWLSTQDFNVEPSDTGLLLANARDTIARFRNHPSIAIWCGRNEGVPPSAINTGLEKLVREVDGTRFYIPNSRFVNLQRSGPWNYGEPVEFFTTRARGFSTELGVPSPPATEAIRAMMPQPDQWPPSDTWSYHDWHQGKGTGVQPFMAAITDHLGAPSGLEDFERKAQMLNYVTHRAMFEGFNANLFHPDSGRLMWMSHPAWPSMVWQLYGSDYDTFGSFYGVKKACEPLHVQLNLPDMAVAVVNTTAQPASNLTVLARLFSADGTLKQKWEGKVSAGPDSVVQALRLDATAADGFLKLELFDSNRNLVSENFYWPYSAAAGLAAAKVSAAAHLVRKGEDAIVVVELANTGKTVALMNRLMVRNAAGERILPAYADDNYINLLPGEKRTVHIACTAPASGALRLSLEGWNTPSAVVEIGKNGGSR